METRMQYGGKVNTENLHNVGDRAAGITHGPQPNYRQFAGALFREYFLTVDVTPGFQFTGEPEVDLVLTGQNDRDARDGFNWNNFPGAPDRFFVNNRSPYHIECTCWAGSHPMTIRLKCLEGR